MWRSSSRRSRLRRGPGRGSGRQARATPPFGLTLRPMHGMRHRLEPRPRPSSACCQCLLCWHWPASRCSLGPMLADARVHRLPPTRWTLERRLGRRAPPVAARPNRRRRSRRRRGTGRPNPTNSGGGGGNKTMSGSTDEQSIFGSRLPSNTGGGGGTGQGSPAKSTPGNNAGSTQQAAQPGNRAPPRASGGSSPLVPILIAISVLAAISLAAVMIRQRRQGGGSGTPAPRLLESGLDPVPERGEAPEGQATRVFALALALAVLAAGGLRLGGRGAAGQLLGCRAAGDADRRTVPAPEAGRGRQHSDPARLERDPAEKGRPIRLVGGRQPGRYCAAARASKCCHSSPARRTGRSRRTGATAARRTCRSGPPLSSPAGPPSSRGAVGRYGPTGSFWAENPSRAASARSGPGRSGTSRTSSTSSPIRIRPNTGKLVKLSYSAINSVDPGAKLILGGLFARPSEADPSRKPPLAYFAAEFLEKMYGSTPGIKSKFQRGRTAPLHLATTSSSTPYDRRSPRRAEGEPRRRQGALADRGRLELAARRPTATPSPRARRARRPSSRAPSACSRSKRGASGTSQRVYWFSVDDQAGRLQLLRRLRPVRQRLQAEAVLVRLRQVRRRQRP